MPFQSAGVLTPTRVNAITIRLKDWLEDTGGPNYGASFICYVEDQNGEPMEPVAGNLVPHISTADRNWLIDFMQRMREKAETEILPE